MLDHELDKITRSLEALYSVETRLRKVPSVHPETLMALCEAIELLQTDQLEIQAEISGEFVG